MSILMHLPSASPRPPLSMPPPSAPSPPPYLNAYPAAAAAAAAAAAPPVSYRATSASRAATPDETPGETREAEGQKPPRLDLTAEGESRIFVPSIEVRDFNFLEKRRIKAIENAGPGLSTWVPGSKAWKDSIRDSNAKKIVQEYWTKYPRKKQQGESEEPKRPCLEYINRARDAASESHKCLYDIDEATFYLEEKEWVKAAVVLEKLRCSQTNIDPLGESMYMFLLAKTKALNGQLYDAYLLYEQNIQNKKWCIEVAPQHQRNVFHLLTEQVRDHIEQTSLPVQKLVAERVDINNEALASQLLAVFEEGCLDVWEILAWRIPSDKLHWKDLERLGSRLKRNHLTTQAAISCFGKAIAKAPAEEHQRLWKLHYEVSKDLSVLKKIAEFKDPKMMLAYAREIRKSNTPEALSFVKEAKAISSGRASRSSSCASDGAAAAPPGGAGVGVASSDADPAQVEGVDLETAKKAVELRQLIFWEQGAEREDAECLFQLAQCCRNGTHDVAKDIKQAQEYLRRAHQKKHPEAAFERAAMCDPASDEKQRKSWLEASTALGHKEAPYLLGMMVLESCNGADLFYPSNFNQTDAHTNAIIEPLYKAMDRGNEKALKLKAFCECLKCVTLPKSDAHIFRVGEAYYQIARCFNGEEAICASFPKSQERYEKWMQWAAYYGHPKALTVHASKLSYISDLSKGIERLRDRSKAGDAEAQYLFATYLEAGEVKGLNIAVKVSSSSNETTAKDFYVKSADQNHLPAQMRLAEIYLAEKANDKAFALYQKAAETGDAEAVFRVGCCFRDALGTEKNLETAEARFLQATEKEHAKSMTAIGDLYKAKDDRDKAEEWYSKATTAKIPDPEGFARLASLDV